MTDLKQTILDASVGMIAKEGVRSLSFRKVAKRAKVSHQAPYHYFESHHDILRAIAKEGFLKLAQMMQEAADEHPKNPLNALTASGIAYVRFAREHLGHFRVMFQNSLICEGKDKGPLLEAEKAHKVLVELAKAVSQSGVNQNLDSETLALLCWSVVHGIATLLNETIIQENKETEDQIASTVVRSMHKLLQI